MEAKVRDDILDRVMGVLVQEEGGRKVLSKRVEKIMLSYANVRKINEEETSPASEDSFSESEDALQSNILQNVKNFNNHFQKNQALKINLRELQVPATIFLMTSSHCGISFLQNVQLFNIHFQKTQAPKKMSTLSPQVPATTFLMTSSHCSLQCRSPFLQND